MAAEKDRTGIADPTREVLSILGNDFKMFGGEAVGQRGRFVEGGNSDDGAIIAPARAGDTGAWQRLQLAHNLLFHGVGQSRAVGDENRLRGSVVLGLGEEIGGD